MTILKYFSKKNGGGGGLDKGMRKLNPSKTVGENDLKFKATVMLSIWVSGHYIEWSKGEDGSNEKTRVPNKCKENKLVCAIE